MPKRHEMYILKLKMPHKMTFFFLIEGSNIEYGNIENCKIKNHFSIENFKASNVEKKRR